MTHDQWRDNAEKTSCNFTWKRPLSLANISMYITTDITHAGQGHVCMTVGTNHSTNTCLSVRKQEGKLNAMQRFATLSAVDQWSDTNI
jgi:hypothetical protein